MGSSRTRSARSALRFWRAAAALRAVGREEAVLRCVLMGCGSDDVEPVRMPGPGWGFSNQVLRACRAQEGAGRDGRWRALPVTTILLSRRSWPRTTGQAVLSDLDVLRVACIAQRSPRSEEHTSELQSLLRISYAVFCLTKKN